MPHPPANALALARRALRLLIALNLLMGLLILALLIASLVVGDWVMRALGVPSNEGSVALFVGLRLVMLVGILSTPVTHVALTRLLSIVLTVNQGDPFVAENAQRLQQIAWAVLGLELLHLCVGLVEACISSPAVPLDLAGSFSPTPWLAVLLLFVLARVFDHGTRLREELEGTV